jgi:hypothetical protein
MINDEPAVMERRSWSPDPAMQANDITQDG